MGDKTSDENESEDEFDHMTSDGSDTEERVKVSSNIMDSSGHEDESDNDKLDELFNELRISSELRPPGLIRPNRKPSLMAKLEERLTICESSSIALSFDEQTAMKYSTLRKQDQMMLDFAKSGKKREMVTLLVHTGANLNSRDITGNTGLHIGAKFGCLKIVETFLDRGLDVDTQGFDNSTALIMASFSGETAVVKLLLSWGPDIEHVNKSGNTALTEAIANGYPDIVSLLVKHGAVDRKENQKTGKLARQSTCVVEMFNGLRNPANLNELLIKAAGEGKGRLVSGLITAGADMETRSDDGKNTGFHIAVKKGHECVVRTFLDHNIDINIRGDKDETALIMAVRRKNNFSTIKMLLDRGAKMNLQSKNRDTALIEAAKRNRMREVCELLERNADRNIKNKDNKTAFDFSEEYYNHEVTFLLDERAQTDPESDTGKEALTTATENGNVELVSKLLKRNVVASGKTKNSKGENIFQIASKLPQTREKEFRVYSEKIKKNKEAKPDDTLTAIVEDARQISIKLKKLFLSQPLFKHDQSLVSDRIFDIKNYILEDFNEKHFDEDHKFYANYDINNRETTLLEFVVNHGMLKEREEVLDAMLKVDKQRHPNDPEAEFRMKKEVKNTVPSSKGLRDCLQSIEDRFPWSQAKYWFTISMSFFVQVIIGPGFYGLDVYTDIRFTMEMFSQAQRNFTHDIETCRPDFESDIDHVVDYCKTNLTQEVCTVHI